MNPHQDSAPAPEPQPAPEPPKSRIPTLEMLEAHRQENLRKYWGITDKAALERHSLIVDRD